MKKLAFLLFVCLLSLTFYFELYAKQDKVSRRNIRNVTEVTNKANDGTIEGKNKLDNIITAEPIKLNDNSYYFIKGKKVIELNLKTKEFKEYAEGIKKRQNYWLQVGADGHIYEIKNSELSITNTESASESTDSERGVKSRGSRKNIKSAKQSKYNLKSVDKRGSSSKRGARSAAGETQTDEKITKFSVVAQDGFMYEYDLEKKTTTKKEKFDGEIKTNFIQIIDTNNELEEIDISKLSDSRNGELTNSGEVSADKSNTESGERGVKSRSVRSVEKKTKSNTRKVRSANRGVRSASGEAENAVAEEELSESGLIIVKLKEEYIKLVEAEEKIFTGEAVADKPLVIKKGAEYFYWIEGDIVYEINMAFMRAAEFSKVNFGDKDKWYAVRPDGQIVMFPITAASAEESTDAAGSDRGVRSRATKKVQKKNVKSRSVRSARGAIDAEEYKPVDVPKTEGDNFYFVGKDNSIYLVDRINNEIRRVKEYDGELKTGNICLIFPGGKKVDAPIEELIPEEDEEQIASADDSKRGARSRTARSRQTSKTKIKGKSVKKSARSVKSVNPNTGQEEIVELVSANRPATASSTPYSWAMPASAVDGSQYSNWYSRYSNVQNQTEWLTIDLERVRPLRKIRILWDSYNYPSEYKIQGSTDNQNWTDIVSITNQTSVSYGQFKEHTANMDARYVRALMTKTRDNWGGNYYIYEFEVYAAVSAQDKIQEVDDFITKMPSAAEYEKIFTNITADTLMRFASLPFQMMSQMNSRTPITFDMYYKEITKYPSNKIDPIIIYEVARERFDALKKMNIEDKDFSTFQKFSPIRELAKKTKLDRFTTAYNALPEPEKLEGWHEQYVQQIGQLAMLVMNEGFTEKDFPGNEKIMKCYEEFKTARFAVKRAVYYIDMILKQPLDPASYSYESTYQSFITSMEYQINNAKQLGAKDADITNLSKFIEFKAGFVKIPVTKFDNAVKSLPDVDPVVFNNSNEYSIAKSNLQYTIDDLYNTAKSKGAKDSDFTYFAKYKKYKDAVAAVESKLSSLASTVLTYYNGDLANAWKNKDKIAELKKNAAELTKMGFYNSQTNADKIDILIADIAQIDKNRDEVLDSFKKLPAPGTYNFMDTAQFSNILSLYYDAVNKKNYLTNNFYVLRRESSSVKYIKVDYSSIVTEKELTNMDYFIKLKEEYDNYLKETKKFKDEFNALLNSLESTPLDEADSKVARINYLHELGIIYQMGANAMLKDWQNRDKLWAFVNKLNAIKNRFNDATALVKNLPDTQNIALKDKDAIANARKKLNECGWPIDKIDKALFAKLDALDEVIKNSEEGNNRVITPLMDEYNKLYINTNMVRGEGWSLDAKIHFDIEEVRRLKAKFDDAVAKGYPIKADPNGKFYAAERLYSIFKPNLDRAIDVLKAIPAPEEINTSNFRTIANAENLMAEARNKGWVDTQFIGSEKIEPAKVAGLKLKQTIDEINIDFANLNSVNNNDWYAGKYGTYFEDCEKILPKIEAAKKINAVDADFPNLWKLDRYKSYMSEKLSFIQKVNEMLAAFPAEPVKDTVFDRKKNAELLTAYNEAVNKGAKYSNFSEPQKTEKWVEAIKAFNEKIAQIDNAFATLPLPDAPLTKELKEAYEKAKNGYEEVLKIGASDTDFKHLSNFKDLSEPVKFYNEYVAFMPQGEHIIRPTEYILSPGQQQRVIQSKNKAYTWKTFLRDERIIEDYALINMTITNSMNEPIWTYKFENNRENYIGLRLKKDGRIMGLQQQRKPDNTYWNQKISERYEMSNAGAPAYLMLTDSGSLVFFDKDGKELKKIFENKNPHIMSDEEFKALNLPSGQDVLIDGKAFTQWGKEVITSQNGIYNVMMITTREEALGGGNFNYHHSLILADKDWDWVWTSNNFIGSKLTMRRDGRLMLSGARDARTINEKYVEPLGAYLQITDNGLFAMFDQNKKVVYKFAQGPEYNYRKEQMKKGYNLALKILPIVNDYNTAVKKGTLDVYNIMTRCEALAPEIETVRKSGVFDTEIVLPKNNWGEIQPFAPYNPISHLKPDELNSFFKIYDDVKKQYSDRIKADEERAKKYTRGTLKANEELKPGEIIYHQINHGVQLVFEPDLTGNGYGELKVIWPPSEYEMRQTRVYWSQKVSGGKRCVLTKEGNLVILDKNNKVVWETGTEGNPTAEVSMDTQNRLQILVDGKPAMTRAERQKAELIKTPRKGQTFLLYTGSVMNKGDYIQRVILGTYILRLTDSGNLEYIINRFKEDVVMWSVGSGKGDKLVVEKDGNLVLYDKDSKILWQSEYKYTLRDAIYMIDENGDFGVYAEPLDEYGKVDIAANPMSFINLKTILNSKQLEANYEKAEKAKADQAYNDFKLQFKRILPGRKMKSGEWIQSDNEKNKLTVGGGLWLTIDPSILPGGLTKYLLVPECESLEYKEDGNLYFYNENGKVVKKLEKGFKKGVFYVQDGGQVIFTNNSEAEILWNTDMQKMEDTKRRIFGPRGMGLYLEAGDAMYPGDELPSVWGDVGFALDKGLQINKGKSRLHFQMDGNLVMKSYYDEAKQKDTNGNLQTSSNEISYWETKTTGRGTKVVVMKNGNLVVVDKDNKIIWQANTSGYPQAMFTITDGHSILMRDFLGNMLASGNYPTIVVDKNQPAAKPSDLEKAIDTAKQIKETAMMIKDAWKNPEGMAKLAVAAYGEKSNALPPAPEFKVVTRDVSEELLPLKETTPRQGDYYKLTSKQEKAKQAAIDAINAISSLEPMLVMISDKPKIAEAKKLVDAAIAEGVKETEISYSIKSILDSLEKSVNQLETYLEEESKKTPLPAELKVNKWYYLKTKHSNMYLRVKDTKIVQSYFPDNGAPGNEFKFFIESDGKGYYWLKNALGSGCIGIMQISNKSAGTALTLWNKEDVDNYKWSIISTGNGYYKLKLKHSNLFMNVSGGNNKDGAEVVQWSTDGAGNNEQFILEDAEVSKTSTTTTTTTQTTSTSSSSSNSAANSSTPVNLALGRTTATSSSNENNVNTAEKAFDGNTGTRWASVGGVDPQWLMVDLGAEATISKVVLTWEAAAGKVYKIQVSNDGNNWTDAASVTDGTSNAKREITINNAKGRYVRMYGTTRANTWYGYSIWEFEIWGVKSSSTTTTASTTSTTTSTTTASSSSSSTTSSATPVNLALGRTTATSSSNENSVNTAEKAFDGNAGTRWASVGGVDPQWLMVDLGAEATISKVVLTWEAAAGKVYKIQVSNDGNNWADAASVSDGTSNAKREITINNAKGRYFRMYGTTRANTWYGYSIWEFEIWGVLTGASQTSVDAGKPKNGSSYKIQSKHSGMLVSVDNSGTNNGANVSQQPDNNLNSQIWKLEDMGGGYFKLVNKNSGKCLDVSGGSTTNGGNLHQWDYANGNNQVWKFEETSNGYYKILVKHVSKCIDIAGGSKNAGGNIQQWDYAGGDNQQWKLIEVK